MPLISSLWTGTSGLMTANNALNTTAHNLSNVDTEGYTRQQVTQGTRPYNTISKTNSKNAYQQVGLGAEYTTCKQVRSVFLDQSYRAESGRAAFYNVSYDCLVETEDLLQEMDGAEFADSLTNLWTAIQALDVDPANTVNMNTLVSRASEFVNRAQNVYQGLKNYQANMDSTVDGYVKQINEIGDRISELNKNIVQVENGARERANDMRDERNLLLDKLGELGRITYDEDIFGNVSVYFEDVPFVLTDHVNHMAVDRLLESSENYATPYWEFMATTVWNPVTDSYLVTDISNAKVYDLSQNVSSAAGTDIGKLRSILLARGDHNATWHDITGGIAKDREGNPMVVDDDKVQAYYNRNISQSVVMNIEAEFDQLIHNIVEKVNEVFENAASNPARLNPDAYVTDDHREEAKKVLAMDRYNKAYDKLTAAERATIDGDSEGIEKEAVNQAAKQFDLFTLLNDDNKSIVRYTIGTEAMNGTLDGYEAGSIRTGSTVTNIKVNDMFVKNPSVFSMRDSEGNEDKAMTEALKKVFKDENYTLNPTVATKTSFIDYYDSLVAQVANSGSVYDSITEQQNITVSAINSAREQIVGVSSDEELEYMIQFQNAYNASSRYINVVSEMLEHIVNALGR